MNNLCKCDQCQKELKKISLELEGVWRDLK